MGNLFASERTIGKRIGQKQGKEFIENLPVADIENGAAWIERRRLMEEIDSITSKENSSIILPTIQRSQEWRWKKEVLKKNVSFAMPKW